MGCANSKAADNKSAQPSGLQFNAADLDDVDQSTHRKKKVVQIPAATNADGSSAPPAADAAGH